MVSRAHDDTLAIVFDRLSCGRSSCWFFSSVRKSRVTVVLQSHLDTVQPFQSSNPWQPRSSCGLIV